MKLASSSMVVQPDTALAPRPALFLDRDGVINRDTGYPWRPIDIVWIDGVFDALALARRRGFRIFVVTNQSGVGRGLYQEEDVRALHAWMGERLAAAGASVDDWRYCPYHPAASVPAYRQDHPWRKPSPGMIQDILRHWPTDLTTSLLIGDRQSDIIAARAAGIEGHLFSGDNLLKFLESLPDFAEG